MNTVLVANMDLRNGIQLGEILDGAVRNAVTGSTVETAHHHSESIRSLRFGKS